jgi:hypothetical protein
MMNRKGNEMDLKPMNPADILRMDARRANVEFANARVEMFKSDAQKMQELANHFRKVNAERMESYKNHVVDTFLDCEYNKVKISKRVAKVPKYARAVVRGRAMSTVGDSFTMGGVKARGRQIAAKGGV